MAAFRVRRKYGFIFASSSSLSSQTYKIVHKANGLYRHGCEKAKQGYELNVNISMLTGTMLHDFDQLG